jgi:hypothetical protein
MLYLYLFSIIRDGWSVQVDKGISIVIITPSMFSVTKFCFPFIIKIIVDACLMSKIRDDTFILTLRSRLQYFTSIINSVSYRGGGISIESENHSVQRGTRAHKAPHKTIRAAKPHKIIRASGAHRVWDPPSLLCTGGSRSAPEAAKAWRWRSVELLLNVRITGAVPHSSMRLHGLMLNL